MACSGVWTPTGARSIRANPDRASVLSFLLPGSQSAPSGSRYLTGMSTARRLPALLAAAVATAATVTGTVFVLAAGGSAATAPASALRTPTTGVVVIETDLGYQGGEAAGTGMVLTASGKVLTNNHVIRGATAVRVVVPSSGRTYAAKVVGYSVSSDVAVLQLSGASGLDTVTLGSSAGVSVGQSVTAVGNAGGTGTIVTAEGSVTALDRTITASDDQGSAQRMTGLIQTDAELQPGDSGGPLLDASGKVIGIDSAATSTFSFDAGAAEGYAIPIDRALALSKQISSGKASSTVHVGATAWLGISVQSSIRATRWGYDNGSAGGGTLIVSGVIAGGPADRAGIRQGTVITAIAGKAVGSASELIARLQTLKPGSTVKLALSDGYGSSTTASVKLGSGPPQ